MKTLSQAPAPAVHRYPDTGLPQVPGEGEAGELAALVGIEELRRAMAGQRLVERLDAEARIQGVRQAPGQHMPARPVHDRHQVKEAAPYLDVGNVGAPDLVRPFDLQTLEQIGIDPALGMRLAGARCSIDRLKPHQAHQPTGPATTDAHTLAAQVTDHLTGAVRTDTSRTTHQYAASAPESPRSRPWTCSRARSAQSTANGIGRLKLSAG